MLAASKSFTIALLPTCMLLSGQRASETDHWAGQGLQAILGLSRPKGLFRQPSMGQSFLSSPWPGSLPPLQPPKAGPTTESSADFQGKSELGVLSSGGKIREESRLLAACRSADPVETPQVSKGRTLQELLSGNLPECMSAWAGCRLLTFPHTHCRPLQLNSRSPEFEGRKSCFNL